MEEKLLIKMLQKYGMLTPISEARTNNKRACLCQCECGNKKVIDIYSILSGVVVSCGCYRNKKAHSINKKHGYYNTRLYQIWENIKQRCLNPNSVCAKNYNHRGISICDEWKSDFQSFYNWSMLNGYADNLTIERKDNNGNYEPGNCKWISNADQQLNKRTNRLITYNGKTQPLSVWVKDTGMSYKMLQKRIDNWGVKMAFETPSIPRGYSRINYMRNK